MSGEEATISPSVMKRALIVVPLCIFSLLDSAVDALVPGRASAAQVIAAKTLVLYDAASGAIPAAPPMSFTDFPPGAALPSYSDGTTILDTTAAGNDTYAGWVVNGASIPDFPILDRTQGFQVNFTVQVENESHTGSHRSGFSVIILSQDARGVELAFWENEIWAQSDDLTGGLFRHGEGVTFDTTASLTQYQVAIAGDTYTLTANVSPILTGPVRDYTKFDGFPDPYETPNFLFLGDDTTSAQARVRLSFVSVTGAEPVLPTDSSTSTSLSSPVPAASATALSTATPPPSPAPTPPGIELCSSGWIFLAVITPPLILAKRVRLSL